MTFSMTTHILSAERDLRPVRLTLDARFAPASQVSLRGVGIHLIRTAARKSLQLADRLDPGYRYA